MTTKRTANGLSGPATEGLEVRETFKRASEFAPHVTVTEETFFSHGWQPLTIAVLQTLWFLPSDTAFDIPFLVDWYARLGWKGANGKPLGENVVRREIGLIRDAGYVSTTRLRGEGGRAVGIQYTVSQRRSDQPQDGAWLPVTPSIEENRRSHHVPPLATCGDSPHVANGENRRSHHVPPLATPGESPHVADDAKPQVAPRATNGVSPPHPPEGGGNTSPNPHKSGRAAKWAAACALAPDDYAPTAEEIKAADAFLQDLPDQWQMGVDEARALAPLLASRVRALDLDLDLMLQLQLVQDDPQNPVRVPARVMPTRIRGLKRRRAGGGGAGAVTGGLAEWCTKCNRGEFPMAVYQRTVELPDGTDVPCRDCHPKYVRA
ncbi:hypothetical protein ABZU94_34900 [Streptomyces mirabilis]|uniref:hypothetical protein n=1 Tax=Streptomyces sp. NPDC005388 TaxID=3156717 RepID=UPI0033A862E4